MNKQKTLCLGLTTLLLAGAMAAAETPVSADRQMSNDQTAKARRADDNFLGLQVRFLEQSGNGFVQYKMKLIDCGDVDNVQAEYSIFYRMRVGRGFYRTDSSEFFPLIPSKSDHSISSRWLWVSKR